MTAATGTHITVLICTHNSLSIWTEPYPS